LQDVSINISGSLEYTNEFGYYNTLVDVGKHVLIAKKQGYQTYIDYVENVLGQITWKISP
jgi:hypothetical protein